MACTLISRPTRNWASQLWSLLAVFTAICLLLTWRVHASSPPYQGPWLDGPIELEVSSKSVPATVRIVGPKHLVDALHAVAKAGGEKCQFGPYFFERASVVNWDDDKTGTSAWYWNMHRGLGQPCSDPTVKVYRVPGSYTIGVASWQPPKPSSGPHLPWRGTATVEFGGRPEPLSFELTSPTIGDVLPYGHTFKAGWKIIPDMPVVLTFSLLDQGGGIVSERRIEGIRYTGEGQTHFGPQLPEEIKRYEQRLLAGQDKFTLRATLSRNGEILITRDVAGIVGGREITYQGFTFAPPVNQPPNTVLIKAHPHHLDCFSASIDWGDGTSPTVHEQPVRTSCGLTRGGMDFLHTYAKPGTYRVRMRINSAIFRPLSEQAGYIERWVEVRSDNTFKATDCERRRSFLDKVGGPYPPNDRLLYGC